MFIGWTDAEAETLILLATWCKEVTSWKSPWCWERLKAGGEVDETGWYGWMPSLAQWTWVWVNSGSWWWTGRPGVQQSMGLQRVGHNWVSELNWCREFWHLCSLSASTIFLNKYQYLSLHRLGNKPVNRYSYGLQSAYQYKLPLSPLPFMVVASCISLAILIIRK